MQLLNAGKIQVAYHHGFLRYFKNGQDEVLRMIYFAVRNANWENIAFRIENEQIASSQDAFEIQYNATFYDHTGHLLKWDVRINGLPGGEVIFSIDGRVMNEFRTNRAGFCILHPIERIAGKSVTVFHSNNTTEICEFPRFIAPHQPFIDITAMKWEVGGSKFTLHFEGDIFEIEDQRNWGDASYKTYCTPLSLPFPRTLKTGERITQKVIFNANLIEEKPVVKSRKKLPSNRFEIGTGFPGYFADFSKICIQKLKMLRLSHYRLDVCPSEEGWEQDFFRQIWYAGFLETNLELVLHLSPNFRQELEWVLLIISDRSLPVSKMTLLSKDELVTSQEIIDHIPVIKSQLAGTHIGIGTRFNFTELNRHRFHAGQSDYISLGFDPQEHASDDLTIIENAATFKYMAESLRSMYGKPAHFSPVLLKRKYNPYATDPSEIALPLEKQLDERQQTGFLAEWVSAVFENLESTDIPSVTLFEAIGPVGLMDEKGSEYPVYQTLMDYAGRN